MVDLDVDLDVEMNVHFPPNYLSIALRIPLWTEDGDHLGELMFARPRIPVHYVVQYWLG